jgi:hypothetical protein
MRGKSNPRSSLYAIQFASARVSPVSRVLVYYVDFSSQVFSCVKEGFTSAQESFSSSQESFSSAQESLCGAQEKLSCAEEKHRLSAYMACAATLEAYLRRATVAPQPPASGGASA